jgi:hypothetical protein
VFEPGNDDRGVQPAAVSQDDFFDVLFGHRKGFLSSVEVKQNPQADLVWGRAW